MTDIGDIVFVLLAQIRIRALIDRRISNDRFTLARCPAILSSFFGNGSISLGIARNRI